MLPSAVSSSSNNSVISCEPRIKPCILYRMPTDLLDLVATSIPLKARLNLLIFLGEQRTFSRSFCDARYGLKTAEDLQSFVNNSTYKPVRRLRNTISSVKLYFCLSGSDINTLFSNSGAYAHLTSISVDVPDYLITASLCTNLRDKKSDLKWLDICFIEPAQKIHELHVSLVKLNEYLSKSCLERLVVFLGSRESNYRFSLSGKESLDTPSRITNNRIISGEESIDTPSRKLINKIIIGEDIFDIPNRKSNNKLINVSPQFPLVEFKAVNPQLNVLQLNNFLTSPWQVSELSHFLRSHGLLRVLAFRNNRLFDDKAICELADGLKNNTTLRSLDISGHTCSMGGLLPLAQVINVRRLNVSSIYSGWISYVVIPTLVAETLASRPSLRHFSALGYVTTPDGMRSLMQNSSLYGLEIGSHRHRAWTGSSQYHETCSSIAAGLELGNLQFLRIPGLGHENEDLEIIFQGLLRNASLKMLDMSVSSFGIRGTHFSARRDALNETNALLQVIEHHPTLEELYLNQAYISNAHLTLIRSSLQKSRSLKLITIADPDKKVAWTNPMLELVNVDLMTSSSHRKILGEKVDHFPSDEDETGER
jgi:hypothetical protein